MNRNRKDLIRKRAHHPGRTLQLIVAAMVVICCMVAAPAVYAGCEGIPIEDGKIDINKGKLDEMSDDCGGHLVERHVDISDDELKARAPKLKGGVASKFASEKEARLALEKILNANIDKVQKVKNGDSAEKFRDAVSSVGVKCVNKACPDTLKETDGTEKVFVFLKGKGSGDNRKVYFQTAYPEADCSCP